MMPLLRFDFQITKKLNCDVANLIINTTSYLNEKNTKTICDLDPCCLLHSKREDFF